MGKDNSSFALGAVVALIGVFMGALTVYMIMKKNEVTATYAQPVAEPISEPVEPISSEQNNIISNDSVLETWYKNVPH